MELHELFLFLHVSSAMGLFTALGVEGLCLRQLGRADGPRETATALGGLALLPPVGGASTLLLLVSGIYLATTRWHWQGAWIGLGFAGLVLVALIGALVTGRALARVRPTAGGETGRGWSVARAAMPTLAASFCARAAILLGVVFLMTVKPQAPGALATMAVALAVGGAAGLAVRARAPRAVLS